MNLNDPAVLAALQRQGVDPAQPAQGGFGMGSNSGALSTFRQIRDLIPGQNDGSGGSAPSPTDPVLPTGATGATPPTVDPATVASAENATIEPGTAAEVQSMGVSVPEGVTADELAKAREAAAQRSGGFGENLGRVLLSLGSGGNSRDTFAARDKQFLEEGTDTVAGMAKLRDRAAERERVLGEQAAIAEAARKSREEGRDDRRLGIEESEEERAQREAEQETARFGNEQSDYARTQAILADKDRADSDISAAARAAVRQVAPGIASGMDPERFDKMTATEFEEMGLDLNELVKGMVGQTGKNRERDEAKRGELQDLRIQTMDIDEMIGLITGQPGMGVSLDVEGNPIGPDGQPLTEGNMSGISTGVEEDIPMVTPVKDWMDPERRTRFRQLSANLQLAQTDKLKGVLSDTDMRLLRDSIANLASEETANLKSLVKAQEIIKRGMAQLEAEGYTDEQSSGTGQAGSTVNWEDM